MLSLIAATVLAAAPPSPDVYAIIVGWNGGADGLPALHYADDDALRFARWFRAVAPEENLTLLTALDDETKRGAGTLPPMQPPTRSALLAAIDSLKHRLAARPASAPPARVYFLYAGHGLPGRFLLEPEDTDQAAFTGRELKAAFASIPAQRAVLFLDACRAQSLFTERGGGVDFSREVIALEQQANDTPVGILTAATSDTPAGEAASLQGGFFSHVLASGLAGAADVDGDHLIRFSELAAFVAFNTQALTGQRPWFEPPNGDVESVALDLTRSPGFSLGRSIAGRVRIKHGGQLVAKAHKAANTTLTFALPPGEYLVDLGTALATVQVPAPRTLERGEFQSTRGDEALDGPGFTAPFTRDVVTTLSVGYQSGREPTETTARLWHHAVDLSYGGSSVPFFLGGMEHGGEVGYRFGVARYTFGVRAMLRASRASGETLWRAGGALEYGLRFHPVERIELSPHVMGTLQSVWKTGVSPRADFVVPGLAGGLRVEISLGAGFSIRLEGRLEAAWLTIDGTRQPFVVPLVLLGATWKRL